MNIINGPNANYHVVDCSTDHCPRCGEVLNQCTCPQVLQRVDFNEELEAENKQLKAQLEKLYTALSFYKSAITCGEEWTEECESMWKEIENVLSEDQ